MPTADPYAWQCGKCDCLECRDRRHYNAAAPPEAEPGAGLGSALHKAALSPGGNIFAAPHGVSVAPACPEVAAMSAVHAALDGLDYLGRVRVLWWAQAYFGVGPDGKETA